MNTEVNEQPKRKPNRLINYDYSKPGAYFITICTRNKENLFWENVGASIARPQDILLTEDGKIVDYAINQITNFYKNISIDHYVIMPNHIHILLQIHQNNGRAMLAPTISKIIQQMKGYITKKIRKPIWQKLFHDHIIRGQSDYEKIWEYIEENPIKWQIDCFYNDEKKK